MRAEFSGCVAKEGKTMERPMSDLPHRIGGERIIIVQPQITVGMEKSALANPADENLFQRIFARIFWGQVLIHAGSLQCDNNFTTPGCPIHFKPCGGELSTAGEPPKWLRDMGWGGLFFSCSNPACQMELGSRLVTSELQNIMLHLALKQMFTRAPFCNYVDCDQRQFDDLLHGEMLKNIQELGVIAVASELMFGKMDNGYFGEHPFRFSLGFMLMQGIRTLYGFDGYDEWVNFLFSKKMEQINSVWSSMKPFLLGSKPA